MANFSPSSKDLQVDQIVNSSTSSRFIDSKSNKQFMHKRNSQKSQKSNEKSINERRKFIAQGNDLERIISNSTLERVDSIPKFKVIINTRNSRRNRQSRA